MTINEAMVLERKLKERRNDLATMRNANLVSTRRWEMFTGGQEKERTEITPKYDPKLVDTKVTEIDLFLYKLDAAIKKANAITEITITADVDKLLAPIQ